MLSDLIILITIINIQKKANICFGNFSFSAGRTKDSNEKRQRNETFQTEATNAFHFKT